MSETKLDKRFITKLGQKDYIGRDGRLFKMDERFGGGGYDVIPRLPTESEYNFIRRMMGLKDTDPCIVIVGEIFVDGVMKYRDFGVATRHNMPANNAGQFEKRGLEIATTRAVNRAMGLGTAGGFADPDAKYDRKGYVPATDSAQANFLKEMQRIKKLVGEENYRSVLVSHGFTKSNDEDLCTDAEAMQSILSDMYELLEDTDNDPSQKDGQPIRDEIKRMQDEMDEVEYPEHFDNLLDKVLKQPAMQRKLDSGETVGDVFRVRYAEHVMDTNFDKLFEIFNNASVLIDNQ